MSRIEDADRRILRVKLRAHLLDEGRPSSRPLADHFKTKPDVAIVVFGENPYAEFQGDSGSVEYSPGNSADLELLREIRGDGVQPLFSYGYGLRYSDNGNLRKLPEGGAT